MHKVQKQVKIPLGAISNHPEPVNVLYTNFVTALPGN